MSREKECRSPVCKTGQRRGYPGFTQLITLGHYITDLGFCQTEVSHG